MPQTAEPLEIEYFNEYHPRIEGRERDLSASYVVNREAIKRPEDAWVLVMAGLGEGDAASRHAMGVFDKKGIPAAALFLPLDGFEPTVANLTRVVNELPTEFARFQNDRLGKSKDSKVNLLGSSQGGGAAFMTAGEAPEQYGIIGAMRPVGFNRDAFLRSKNPTAAELRRAEARFVGRLSVLNNLKGHQMPIHLSGRALDVGNLRGQAEILRNIGSSGKKGSLFGKLGAALQLDLTSQALMLKKDHLVRIYAGDKDPVFRLVEIMQTLGKVGCQDLLVPLHGSHSALMSRAGTHQLELVLDDLYVASEEPEDDLPEAA